MTLQPPRQLRLIIEADDFDGAVRFFRDVLGMPEQPAFATTGNDRVSILHAGLATIEIATRLHVQNIDAIEQVPLPAPGRLRLALEVDDTEATVELVRTEGTEVIAPPVPTPFQTINARIQGPAGWQITFFQELESLEARKQRTGFATDSDRAR